MNARHPVGIRFNIRFTLHPLFSMKNTLPVLRRTTLLLCGVSLLAIPGLSQAAQPLAENDIKFMTLYEQIQKALVQDNLNAAKDAAHALADEQGQGILKSFDLKQGREAFAELSKTAEHIVAGNPDYHVFYCPMAKKDWVQQTTTVANPYEGKEMLTCGGEKK